MASPTSVAAIRSRQGIIFGPHKMLAAGAAMTAFAVNTDLIYKIAFFHMLKFGQQRYLIKQLSGQEKTGNQTRPAGLVRGAQPFARIAMEIFEKQGIIPEMGIFLKKRLVTVYRAVPICISGEKRDYAVCQFFGNLIQRKQIARSGRIFNPKVISVVIMKPL